MIKFQDLTVIENQYPKEIIYYGYDQERNVSFLIKGLDLKQAYFGDIQTYYVLHLNASISEDIREEIKEEINSEIRRLKGIERDVMDGWGSPKIESVWVKIDKDTEDRK